MAPTVGGYKMVTVVLRRLASAAAPRSITLVWL